MNTLTLDYTESLPDSARLSRREFEKSMRFAMAAKLFELGRISSGQAAQQVPMDRFGLGQVKGIVIKSSDSLKLFGGTCERFCQRHQEAQPVVLDLEKGARFLDGGDVNA